MPDFRVTNHGSLWAVQPLTDAARDWLTDNIVGENQWIAGALAVEPRYVEPLLGGITDAGFTIS